MVEDGEDGALDEALDDLLLAAVVDGLELDLAGGESRAVLQAWKALLADADGAAHGVGEERLVVGYGGANGHAGALVDVGASAREARDLGDDLLHILGDVHGALGVVLLEAGARIANGPQDPGLDVG